MAQEHGLIPSVVRTNLSDTDQVSELITSYIVKHIDPELEKQWKEKHPEDKFKLSNDMFFLQKCVFETLRLHPASPVAWRKAKCPVHLSNLKTVNEGDM